MALLLIYNGNVFTVLHNGGRALPSQHLVASIAFKGLGVHDQAKTITMKTFSACTEQLRIISPCELQWNKGNRQIWRAKKLLNFPRVLTSFPSWSNSSAAFQLLPTGSCRTTSWSQQAHWVLDRDFVKSLMTAVSFKPGWY